MKLCGIEGAKFESCIPHLIGVYICKQQHSFYLAEAEKEFILGCWPACRVSGGLQNLWGHV